VTASLRLLQVFNQYLEAGGEEVWVAQLEGLLGDAAEVSELRFFSSDWQKPDAPSKLAPAKLLLDNPDSRRKLDDAAAQSKPEALLFHNIVPVGSFGLYDEARRLNLPVLQYIHNFRPYSPSGTLWSGERVCPESLRGNPWPEVWGRLRDKSFPQTFLYALFQKRLRQSGRLDIVKRWIAISDFMRDEFIKAGTPADRVVTLRHCWEPKATPDAARMGGHYLFLGRLVQEKGVRTLIDAWKLLEAKLGEACPQLVIAGTGPEEPYLKEAMAVCKKISWPGFVKGEEKDRLLHECRGLIAPSIWWEPLGLIVYEAYDYGRPVLAAASGGLSEIVAPGVTGYVHPPGDAAVLAADVQKLEEAGRDGRLAMGAAGREWLLANASPQEWRKAFVRIAREAISTMTPSA